MTYCIKKYPLTLVFISLLLLTNCSNAIKDKNATIEVESGTAASNIPTVQSSESKELSKKDIVAEKNQEIRKLIGSWVGYFEIDESEEYSDDAIFVDEGYMWNRDNKINISIDKIQDSIAIGHSVVAGNDRPFQGSISKVKEGSFHFILSEPGDDQYDGVFNFKIEDEQLIGKWQAYKEIEIQNRKYSLEKKNFQYNSEVMLEQSKEYVDWNNVIERKMKIEMAEDEFDEWVSQEFATATDLIYEVNASHDKLSKSLVENLKKGDLSIIRNTIYARHGYSFKNRPLRVFFDAQTWYIPIHTNIKNDFTDLEKQNIQLLLRYEKNAAEYYDSFGRG